MEAVARGGDYRLCDICCPIYERDYENFNKQYFCTGFRIVRSVVEK